MSRISAAARRCWAFVQAGGAASDALRFKDVDWHVGRLLAAGDAFAPRARHPAHVVGNGSSTAAVATPAGAAAAPKRHGQATALYGREIAAGAPASVGARHRLLCAGAPAKSVSVLLAAASARPHHVAPHVDLGAVAAAAGAPAHTVAALDVAVLAAAAYGGEFVPVTVELAETLGALASAAGVPADAAAAAYGREFAWALAEDVGALATVAVAMAEDLGGLSAAAATAPPAHAAAFYCREIRAGEVTAAAGARLLAAGAPARTVARLLAAASARPAPAVGALAAAAGACAPAHSVAAYSPDIAINAGASCSKGTIFGRRGGILSSATGGGRGLRMLCTATGGGGGNDPAKAAVSTAATKSELNDLRAEVLKNFLKTSKETNKIWDEINALRVKTVDTASRIVLSVYGLIGSFMLFIIPYIKVAWQADTVEVVNQQQVKADVKRDKLIADLAENFATLTAAMQSMSSRQEKSDAEIAGVLQAVKENGEKTEALAASMAAEREKKEREKKLAAARWF